MTRLALDQVTDFGDFTKGKDLHDTIKQSFVNNDSVNVLSDLRLSPDGRHIHIILRKPKYGLMTFDKFQRPCQIQCQKRLDLVLAKTASIVDVVYFDDDKDSAVLAAIFENGKAEIWTFSERKLGWHLLQTVDLCNRPSVKVRVVSVCVCEKFIVWCEERLLSQSSSALKTNSGSFGYCICKRTFILNEDGVNLGGVQIAMYNNPHYIVINSGENVYLFPDIKNKPPGIAANFFLVWSPQHDLFKVGSTCNGVFHQNAYPAGRETDFKSLVIDCMGTLKGLSPPGIQGFTATGRGSILLLLSSGWICKVRRDGVLRRVYKLPDNCCGSYSSLSVNHDILALAVNRTLYLIDNRCGQELEKISLKRESMLLASHTLHLLSDAGLFVVMHHEPHLMTKPFPALSEMVNTNSILVEAVFEEACKYYQQRSLGSTLLTAEKLKKGGMFQAPISLAAILREYLSGQKNPNDISKSNWSSDKLLCSLDGELKSLVTMEKVKAMLVCAAEKELQALGEGLVLQEVSRLLSAEVDCDNLIHLNFIFQAFSEEAWQALQGTLQMCLNAAGLLSSNAPAEFWKAVLTPVQPLSSFHVHSHRHPYHDHKRQQTHTPINVALPVFELLCHSVFHFQPSWLPRFLELAQQQAGTFASSGWSYGVVKESSDSVPLYRRALTVLGGDGVGEQQELEVELLLCSQRPIAIMQALRLLMGQGKWERVMLVAERFCRQSPLLNKEIFSTLLCEVAQHRNLDSYLDLLWTLCPEDVTFTSILNTLLKSHSASASLTFEPFHRQSGQLTLGLLKPLLHKVLLRESKPSQRYADILQPPTLPPPTPPRQTKGLSRTGTISAPEPITIMKSVTARKSKPLSPASLGSH